MKSSASRAACLALVLGTAACQDAGGDPTALLLTEDAHPAVVLAAELPSLPGLAAEGRLVPRIPDAIELWIGSWGVPADEGEGRRAEAYGAAAGALADGLGRAGVEGALTRLEHVLAAANRLRAGQLPEAVALSLSAAREEALVARRALEAGSLADAVRATLHGADLLRAVGPEGVARTLIARAEGGLRWAGGPADPLDLARARRLVAGARQAAADADFGLAIQRAYYACQLLGVALQ